MIAILQMKSIKLLRVEKGERMNSIEIKYLTKSFGDTKAVDDLSFSVEKGTFFSFLGINGAGKSTTISMICGELTSDAGEIYIEGKDIKTHMDEVRTTIGVVYQTSALDDVLTVYDNLKYRAALYGITGNSFKKKLEELSILLDFKDFLKKPLNKLSGGQRRRIDIARALIHEPELLILDEPTTGLDPQTRKILWKVIDNLRKEKHMTVFLTTHYMEEAAEADQVVIIDHGRQIASGTPHELKQKYAYDYLNIYHVKEEDIKFLGHPYTYNKDHYTIRVNHPGVVKEMILQKPELFNDFELVKGRMDDVFLNVTVNKLPGGEQS